MFPKVMMLACFLSLAACAEKVPAPVPDSADFVAVTLGQAAEQAHSDLTMLARLRGQGLQPLLPPPDPALAHPVTISWTGSVDGALKEICLQLGYRYKEKGTPSAQPITVVVNGLERSAYDILEDLAWQTQPRAEIRVDPIGRTITLARTAEKEGRP